MADIIWISISSALVFLMQAGFACLESGLVRSKNSINVAIKNLMDLCVSGAIFWAFGYALMFGSSYRGWFGTSNFFFNSNATPLETAFFLFQLMFCGTAITIVSGAVAERMGFLCYIVLAIIMASYIYPIVGHWTWSGALKEGATGWLEHMGFIDFAGSTVVHSVGGWVALAAIIIIGPRLGRFDDGVNHIPGSNLPLSVLGVFLLWFGWFGFNGGSTLAMNEAIPMILLNTCLSALFGGIAAASIKWLLHGRLDVTMVINGVLGGLVGITASCHIVTPTAAALIGIGSGAIVHWGQLWLDRFKIDDAVGAVPAHLFAGIWGTLSVALFGNPSQWQNGHDFYQQLSVQFLGIVVIGAYSFSVSYVLLNLVNRFLPLRVDPEAENMGLNVSEHRTSTEIFDLLKAMHDQQQQGDFSSRVKVEPFTEAGQIAQQYNRVLQRVNQEISQRQRALDAFQASETRKGAILNSSLDCIVTIDKQGSILEFNPAAEKCFGYSRARTLGRNFIDLFVRDSEQAFFQRNLDNEFTESGLPLNHHNRIRLKRIHGVEFPAELVITTVSIDLSHNKEFNFHIRDITRQLHLQNQMRKLAFHDPLTGLYNRGYFRDRLVQSIDFAARHQNSVVLMFLDLDQFKQINDSLGHQAGDRMLCVVAKRLLACVRESDMVCRWGGDEFIVMFQDMEKHSVICQKAQDLLNAIRKPIEYEGKTLYALTSIGIALSNSGKVQADSLIQHADMALYHAKDQGRDTYSFFLPEMEEEANKRFHYETQLRQALEKEQFFLEYQPKVCCRSNRTIGFEALLRWRHPDEGVIPPDRFMPILESSTLIVEVSQWVITNVCRQLRNWRDQGLSVLPVALNLSAKDLLMEGLYSRIESALIQYDIEGNLIELEITETVLAKNTAECLSAMHQLKKLAIKFSIDDFGIGYSSMSYIKKFPVDTLKIDRLFVKECDNNKEDAAICTAIIALGQSLGLHIVAEGVETDAQLAFLRLTGCNSYQGFLFSRALPVDDIISLLQEQDGRVNQSAEIRLS